MFRDRNLSDIYNGAICKSYCWSQNHSDLEIRVKLLRIVKYENINVSVSPDKIRVEIIDNQKPANLVNHIDQVGSETVCLIDGQFEHSVCTDSAYWLLDNDEPSIVIYVDKSESMWWKNLLIKEEIIRSGPRNYLIQMDNLDDGSRMAVDKLITEQRKKRGSGSHEDNLSSA